MVRRKSLGVAKIIKLCQKHNQILDGGIALIIIFFVVYKLSKNVIETKLKNKQKIERDFILEKSKMIGKDENPNFDPILEYYRNLNKKYTEKSR